MVIQKTWVVGALALSTLTISLFSATRNAMAMYKFQQNKLWRDKAPDMLRAYGSIVQVMPLTDAEYDAQLRIKLLEEADEVCVAKNHKELMEELADVCEVVDALCKLHGISKEQLIATQTKKRQEKGGFYERMYVTIAEHPAGSFAESYCRAQPEKYPEVE